MTITYQDGTTVTWPGPTQGEGWTVGPDGLDAPSYDPEDPGQTTNGDPATEQGQRLGAWDDRVRARIAGLGYNEELWMRPRPDGQFSFADSVGLHGSFTWAQGPELTRLDLDPCSHWPASSALEQPLGGGTCRVLMIDGHPVVTSERPFDETSRSALTSVFTVRPDGVAVSLVQPSLEREPTLTREDLARAALTLPAP
ncbi:hypothetical protein [Kineococcus xinjiangensis]|nr:hypothetical protein [Kineococcus xinjiangensis]